VLGGGAPVLLASPQSAAVVAGGNVWFEATAEGGEPLAYQWFFNESPLAGKTEPGFTLASVQPADAGEYRVRVTNDFGAVLSEPALLTVLVPPTIVTPPQSQNVPVGGNAVFTVVATGTAPLAYAWQRNGQVLAGQTSDLLAIAGVNASPCRQIRRDRHQCGRRDHQQPRRADRGFPACDHTANPWAAWPLWAAVTPLNASATGDAPLTAQWRFNGTDLPGETSFTLQLTALAADDSGAYTVRFNNPARRHRERACRAGRAASPRY
jgi:hypothetical protein